VKSDIERWIKKDGEVFLKTIGLQEGHIVLDFGCGEGHYAIPAAKLVGEKGKLYAVDKDKQALDRLMQIIEENNIKNVEVIKKESIIPLENNSLDFILCYDVVHYLKNRKIIYDELYKVLKPEGIFSLYPKHHKNDYPLSELAHMELEDVIEEVEQAGFSLRDKFFKRLIHDNSYNRGYILNFGKDSSRQF
jgi:ubiquinone/menaquinone biosynthesis C-methylase UbiE